MPDEKRIALRLPVVLAARMSSVIAERQQSERKFSMNDWLTEAVREKLERGSEPIAAEPQKWYGMELPTGLLQAADETVRKNRERSAEKIVKNANGIGLDVSAFLAGKLGPPVELHPGETGHDAGIFRPLLPVDEEELDEEDSLYLEKLNREFGPQKLLQAGKLHRQTWGRMTPRQQYDLLCELKERAS